MHDPKCRKRIAYVTVNDPHDKRSWSGTEYFMARALEKHCGEVFYVGPLQPLSLQLSREISRCVRLITNRTYLYTHTAYISRKLGSLIRAKIANAECDFVFAPAGSASIAFLSTDLPIFYLSDATFRLLAGYYSEFSGLLPFQIHAAEMIERFAIHKACTLIYPSIWAARSAIADYQADPAKIRVIAFGANLEVAPSRQDALRPRRKDLCRLLFVGREWVRKGGDIALETLLELEKLGLSSELVVVGCRPPYRLTHPRLRVIPFLNKNDPAERDRLYRLYLESHFFVLPTRAECFAIALCEANAFGLPVLATRTGGLVELIREGVNGFLFAPEAHGDRYAAVIRELITDRAKYENLRTSSRAEYESRLNWDAWGNQMACAFQAAMEPSMCQ